MSGQWCTDSSTKDEQCAIEYNEDVAEKVTPEALLDATSVLDARDGHLHGTWRVVDGPGAVVVDAHTDRVFVASNDVSNGSPNYYIPVACRGLFGQIGCLGRSLAYAARELRKGRTGTVSMFDARTAP
jgi:N-formylglutamate amidohydrolase